MRPITGLSDGSLLVGDYDGAVLIEVTVYREDMAVMSGMLDFTHSTLQFDISNLAPGHYDIYAYSNGRNLHVGEIDVD